MYDTIVVGAGPAGTATAATLAAAGCRVLLLDKARFPRYKTCGGGIDGPSWRALQDLGVTIDSIVEETTRELTIVYGGKGPTAYPWPQPLAHMTMRTDLDYLLVNAANDRGAEFRDGLSVRGIKVEPRRVIVETSGGVFSASYLVGADGVYSPIARQFRLNRRPHLFVANEIELATDLDTQAAWRERLLIDISVWPMGYGWVFPKSEHLSVGWGLPKVCARQLRGAVATLRERTGLTGGRVLSDRSHMLGFRRPGQPLVRGRVAVVGDAAGLIDPNTGAGIGWALRSGMLAGQTIARVLRGEAAGLGEYQAAVDKLFVQEHASARVMRNLMMLQFLLFGHRATRLTSLWRDILLAVTGERGYGEWYADSRVARALRWTNLLPI